MKSTRIRQIFLDFFSKKEHTLLPGVPVVNHADPDLLFINSGMNPFKDVFLGKKQAPAPAVANAQPCLRVSGKHNDLEDVGQDTYHHTFFEMLGSWSFGSYEKKKAIDLAWELLTEVYGLSPKDLYVTVFEGDQVVEADTESVSYWQTHVLPNHLLYAGKKDNFWEMGKTGPCGPCTEIHIDLRSAEERLKQPARELVNKDHPEVIEIWNLVFIQFYRSLDGSLKALPKTYVDTGMGFERLTMAIQGKTSTYETDIFKPIIGAIEEKTGDRYGLDQAKDRAFQVIADHIRAVFFGIADGVLPGAQKEGYVIRRILRRALRYGYTFLELKEPFLYTLVPVIQKQLGAIYPQLKKQEAFVKEIIKQEERNFLRTLAAGIKRLQNLIEQLPDNTTLLPGKHVFELYDTYGFPVDLTALILAEQGLSLDEKAFQVAMHQQKKRSKESMRTQCSDWVILSPPTAQKSFVGYDKLVVETRLAQYRRCEQKEQVYYEIVFAQTPFYPEGGGQVGDTGQLVERGNGNKITIWDTKRLYGQIVHYTYDLPADLKGPIQLMVDADRRKAITKNHTATHLLQAALRNLLNFPTEQRGSFVGEDLLRFDFSYHQKIPKEKLKAIEELVQAKIDANISLIEETDVPLAKAKEAGATALFTEKYDKKVRVITIEEGFSKELCQGCHVKHTAEIGFFKIISEQSVASGVRRIVAQTGRACYLWIQRELEQLEHIKTLLKRPKSIVQGVQDLLAQKQDFKKHVDLFHKKELKRSAERLRTLLETNKAGAHLLVEEVTIGNPENLRTLVFRLKKDFPRLKAVLVTVHMDQVYLIVHLPEKQADNQQPAGQLINQLLPLIEGRGGGNNHIAFGTGKLVNRIPAVLKKAREILH